MYQGLHARLKVYRCLLSALSCIGKETSIPRKESPQQSLSSKNMANGHSSTTYTLATECRKHLNHCQESLPVWKSTISMGLKPDASETECEERRKEGGIATPADYPSIPGFEPLVNQRLLPPTFPRYSKLKNRQEAFDDVVSLINRLIHVIGVPDVTCFHEALSFFDNFSREGGCTCVLSRSVLQLAYVPQTSTPASREQFMDRLKDAANHFIRPPSLQKNLSSFSLSTLNFDPNNIKQAVDTFMAQSLRPMMSLLQIRGHNRARQREKWSFLLEELSAFQTESESVDEFLNRSMMPDMNADLPQTTAPSVHLGFFSTWVLYHVIRVMIQFTSSGFELELYSTHEYPYIYWYMSEFLYGWIISTLNRANNVVFEQKSLAELNRAASATGKNAKKVNKANKRKLLKEPKPHDRDILVNRALQQLSGGLFKTSLAFMLEQRLKQPRTVIPNDYSSPSFCAAEKLRYEHRFMPFFAVVSPPVIPYEQYRNMIEQTRNLSSPRDLYIHACQCFDEAKRILEAIPDPNKEVCSFS